MKLSCEISFVIMFILSSYENYIIIKQLCFLKIFNYFILFLKTSLLVSWEFQLYISSELFNVANLFLEAF